VDVLLINPNRELMPWPVIPVGLASIATQLEDRGHAVRLLDLTFSRSLARDVGRAIARHEPDVVALGIRNLDNCNFERPVFFLPEIRDEVVRVVRRLCPRVPLVVGGAAVNVCPGDVLDFLGADYAVVGEGEDAMPALLEALASGSDPTRIAGVLAKGGTRHASPILDTGRTGRSEPASGRALIADPARIGPSRAHRWVDVARYAALGTHYPIQTKRGCALECTYCVYNHIEGHAYRLRAASDVVDEIEEASRHGVRHFELVDSTFNLPLHHARAVCDELVKRRLPVELSTMGLNPAGVSEELVSCMKRAGFRSVMCTPESASDVVLGALHKGFGRQAVVRAAEVLRDAEMPTWWFFLLGAPGETMDTVRETLAFCEEHVRPTDMVLLSTGIRVYPGTPLASLCKESGWFEQADPLFEPSWYVSPELDLAELYDTLVRAATQHPNWMVNAETVVSPTFAIMMKQAFRVVGWKGPFWRHLPKLFGLAGRVGARQKGLSLARDDLGKVGDVQHRR
jgi:radical SAM superfamily enzyme YgiQ (UPF0313 family)